MEDNFLKHESLEIGLINCAYLLLSYGIRIYTFIYFLVISNADHFEIINSQCGWLSL